MAGKIKIEITLNADGTAAVHSSDRSQPIQVQQSSLGQLLDPAADIGKLLDRFAAAAAVQQQKTNVQQAQAQQPPSQQVVAAAVAAAQSVVHGQAGAGGQGQRFTGYQIQQPLASAAAASQSPAATGAFATPQTQQAQPANVQQAQAQPGRTGLQNAAIGVHGFQAGRGIAAAVANPTIGNLANAAATASTLSSLGAVGIAAGAVGTAFGAIAIAGDRLLEAFDNAAERFGEFAPKVAGAQATADVRQTTGDVRRAQLLDDRLAEFVTLQSEASQIWQDIKTILLSASLEAIVPLLRSMLDTFKIAKEQAKAGLDYVGPMLDWLTKLLPSLPQTNIGSLPIVQFFIQTMTLLAQVLRRWLDMGDDPTEGGLDLLFPELPGFRLPAGVVPFRSPVDFPR